MLKELPEKFCLYIPTDEVAEMVLKKLFELGYSWKGFDSLKNFCVSLLVFPIYLAGHKNKSIGYRKLIYGDDEFLNDYPEITLREILERPSPKKEEKFKCEDKNNLPDEFSIWIPTEELFELVQDKLLKMGYKWRFLSGERISSPKIVGLLSYGNKYFISIDANKIMYLVYGSNPPFDSALLNEEISLSRILEDK